MEYKELIVLRGLPASGKSTYAREWVLMDPETRVRLNQDDVRRSLGKYWVPSREPVVKAMLEAGLDAAGYSENPYDIIIDNTNLNPKTFNFYIDWVKRFNISEFAKSKDINYKLRTIDILTDVEECIRRDAERSEPVGEDVIREMYNKYHDKLY